MGGDVRWQHDSLMTTVRDVKNKVWDPLADDRGSFKFHHKKMFCHTWVGMYGDHTTVWWPQFACSQAGM